MDFLNFKLSLGDGAFIKYTLLSESIIVYLGIKPILK